MRNEIICLFLIENLYCRPKDNIIMETTMEESVPIVAEIRNVETENNPSPKFLSREEPGKEDVSKEKIFVRPRFVKVKAFFESTMTCYLFLFVKTTSLQHFRRS